MPKLLAVFASILLSISLSSCKHKPAKDIVQPEQKPESTQADQGSYQTIENEQQAAALNQQAQEQADEVEVQDRVFFGYDSFEVSDEAKKILDTQIAWLKSDSTIKVTIEGHCDERGTREYNIALGEKRANSVKKYLIAGGVEKSRIKTVSYGKERPAFFGAAEEMFSKNRRAVTVVN